MYKFETVYYDPIHELYLVWILDDGPCLWLDYMQYTSACKCGYLTIDDLQ